MGKTLKILLVLSFLFFFIPFIKPTLAIKYDLIPPSGELEMGQEIEFTINIDSQGATINSTQIGMTYDTEYLDYVSTVPGNAMTAVSTQDLGEGKLLFTGTNTDGFSGQGVFAVITLKIIAGSPGSTELCVLWAPTPTPETTTAAPTLAYIAPTSVPPVSGNFEKTKTAGVLGIVFLTLASGFYFLSRFRRL